MSIAMGYARGHLTPTILAFKNILDWMGADERLIACSALLIDDEATPKPAADPKKCTKEQLTKMINSGLSLDDALEVCAKQK